MCASWHAGPFADRRKCRQYRQQQTPRLLCHLRSKHKCFWTNLNNKQATLPDALSSHSAWQRFHQNLCAPPAVPLAKAPSAEHPPAPVSGGLDDVISKAEVQKPLPKLANGKALGRTGWPAEFLRYASYYVEDENGNMKNVWILAPLLTSMLNAFSLGSSIQACVSSGLVTPTHKKGCTLDPANYRPIAVGEPSYLLYIIILNDHLVHWCEKHGLCSP